MNSRYLLPVLALTLTSAVVFADIPVTSAPDSTTESAPPVSELRRFRYRSPGMPDNCEETGRIFHSSVWTGREVVVWGGGAEGNFHGGGFRIDPATGTRKPVSEKGAPAGRWCHAAMWTGSRMIIWGGRTQFPSSGHCGDGAAWDPLTDSWTPLPAEGAPAPRSQMAAVWTGSAMLVWGGFGDGAKAWNDGAAYEPATGKWTPIPAAGAPEARVDPLVVWTGRELVIWGGISPDLRHTMDSGARWNPDTRQWSPVSRKDAPLGTWGHQAVWTGSEMLLWGGARQDGDENTNQVSAEGHAYNPVTDTWRRLPSDGAPAARFYHSTVWTGHSLMVWGGSVQQNRAFFNDGGEFIPAENRWRPLRPDTWAPPRGMHTATWTPSGMVVFGGSTGGSSAFSGPVITARPQ